MKTLICIVAKCLISSCYSKDFVLYVGGHVWALDWCPRVHERLEDHIKCEVLLSLYFPFSVRVKVNLLQFFAGCSL
jgi:hypothetical protein